MHNTPEDVTESPKPWQASLEAIGKRALSREPQPEHSPRGRPAADRAADPGPQALAIREEAVVSELEEAARVGQVGYVARITVQATLPHTDPKASVFQRTNGQLLTLTLMTPPDVGLPYGSMPRVLLAWMTTEAVRTRNRELHLGHSLQEFLDKLGLNRGGGPRGDITRLRNQMNRLLSCAINVRYSDPRRDGLRNALIAEEADLWWDPRRPHERVLWGSTIVLYEKFFSEVVTHPVPVDLAVLRRLRRSPLALDVYSWLTWRMSFLRKQTPIPWEHLEDQFGANYARPLDFRKGFRKALAEVLRHYEARVEPAAAGVVLKPSAPSIARSRNHYAGALPQPTAR